MALIFSKWSLVINMKKFIPLLLALSFAAQAADPIQLFFIQRSKNKNEVRYELLVNDDCSFKDKNPVHGYWQDLEKGPNVRSEIGTFEYIAYGIADQKIEGPWVQFKMKAIENKNFKAHLVKKEKSCEALAYTDFKGQEGVLKKVYIFAVEGFVKPTVKYIELFGVSSNGQNLYEKMEF